MRWALFIVGMLVIAGCGKPPMSYTDASQILEDEEKVLRGIDAEVAEMEAQSKLDIAQLPLGKDDAESKAIGDQFVKEYEDKLRPVYKRRKEQLERIKRATADRDAAKARLQD